MFREVAGGTLRLLRVPPDAPVERVVLPTAPEIKEESESVVREG